MKKLHLKLEGKQLSKAEMKNVAGSGDCGIIVQCRYKTDNVYAGVWVGAYTCADTEDLDWVCDYKYPGSAWSQCEAGNCQ